MAETNTVSAQAMLGDARHVMSLFMENVGDIAVGRKGLAAIQEALLGVQDMDALGASSEYRLPIAIHIGDMLVRDVPSAGLVLALNDAGEPDELLLVTGTSQPVEILGWIDKVLAGDADADLELMYQSTLEQINRPGKRRRPMICSCSEGYTSENVIFRNGRSGQQKTCLGCGRRWFLIGNSPKQ